LTTSSQGAVKTTKDRSAAFELIVFEPVPFERFCQVRELFRGRRFNEIGIGTERIGST
jgi:hypothetical protein